MAYLTICIEFSNPNVVMGHIKDSRVCYSTSNNGGLFPKNFVLYTGRKKNPAATGRGSVKVYENVIIEDTLSELSFDQGIKTFSTFENPQTFKFQIIDFDGAYNYITKNQSLSGRILLQYTIENSEYTIALLDLYSVTVSNGIVTFECDSVSSWNDDTTTTNVFYGDIVNKKLENKTTESFEIYNKPIAVRKVDDFRLPEVFVYIPQGSSTTITADTFEAFKTIYKKAASNIWVMYLDIKDNPLDPSQNLLRSYVNKQVTASIVDGKGVGSTYIGTLIQTYDQGITTLGYAIEFDLVKQDGPELEDVTYVTGNPIVPKIDISTHIKLIVDYTVYDIGSIDISNIESIQIKNDLDKFVSIPKNLVIFENGKLKIPNNYELNYKVSIPLHLEDFTTSTPSNLAKLYNGDRTGSNEIDISTAESIINDSNTDTFVSTIMGPEFNSGGYLFYTFSIGDESSNLSMFKNADRYVLNGKLQSVRVTGEYNSNLNVSYKWFDNTDVGDNIPFEYSIDNKEIYYPITDFTLTDNKWYTLNRYVINRTYTGTVSGDESYIGNNNELTIGEDSDELRTLGLYIFRNDPSISNNIYNIRLYEMNICAEFSYKLSNSSDLYITLNNTHPKANIKDLGDIIADIYTSATNGEASSTLVRNTTMGEASFINTFTNKRKAISELISESPYCLHEQTGSGMEGTDFFYYKALIPSHTWQYSSLSLENLPIIDVKSVSVNDDWINTIRLTSGDTYYQLGKNTEDGEFFRDTNSEWLIINSDKYNIKTSESFNNDGVIKNVEKELKYITNPNSLVYNVDVFGRPYGTTMIPYGKNYKTKFTVPLNIDIVFNLRSFFNDRFIITSHPELFNNSTCVMRINKMDINFQDQIVEFECLIYEIISNPEQIDFTLWFDSPFQDFTDKIQDNMNNGNDGDWYVGVF